MPAAQPTESGTSTQKPAARQDPSWRTLLFCLAGSVPTGLGIAALEASMFGGAVLPLMGLLTVLALPLSLLVLFGVWLLFRPGLPSLSELLESKQSRLRLALLGPLTSVSLFTIAHLVRQLLGAFAARPAAGGVLIGLVTVGLLTLAAYVADALALALTHRRQAISASTSVLLFVLSLIIPLTLLVLLGETSGGDSSFSSFGVLRRAELNLKPVAALLVLFCAAGGSVALARGQRTWWWRRIAPGLVLLGLGVGFFGLWKAAMVTPRDAVRLERGGGPGALLFLSASSLTDRDGDGASRFFGGGDCDDQNARIGPAMLDIPGNSIDEDCDGRDRSAPPHVAPVVLPEAPAFALPEDASVLLLTVDTLRYDLGYVEKARDGRLSPHLDALAARSTVFERAYALASYTSKSLGPMLIGRYPSETQRTFEHFDRFDKSVPFVQERLQRAGVNTLSAQAYWYFFMDGYGLNRGWDTLDHSAAPRAINIDGDSHVSGGKLADVVVATLKRLEEKQGRFFFWAHWVDPHSEYVRHPEFDFGASSRERYDSEVAFVDAALGRVLDALKARSFAERTIVIVTSDHGEAFGEHGMIRHGFEVWEELVRVPLLVYVPGAPARRIASPRSLIDITKTILDIYDIQPDGEDDFVRGQSLLADVALDAKEPASSRPVLVDMPRGPHNQERRAFIDEGKKLITSSGRVVGLYDLAADPAEKKDLSEDQSQVDAALAAQREFLSRLKPISPR